MIDSASVLGVAALAVIAALPVLVLFWLNARPVSKPAYGSEAEERASALLRQILSDEEQRQISQQHWLTVPSPATAARVYRVPLEKGCVEVYDSDRLSMRICVEPIEPLPRSDLVLMHKLMIEGSEIEYLRRANVVYQSGNPRRGTRLPYI